MGKIVHLTEVQFREYIKYSILKENFEGEGIYFNKQGVAMYDPNRTRWQAMDTKLTDGSGNVTPVVTYLPKTHVMAINLYSQLKPKITKMLKHGTIGIQDSEIIGSAHCSVMVVRHPQIEQLFRLS